MEVNVNKVGFEILGQNVLKMLSILVSGTNSVGDGALDVPGSTML
jgi:hypothetical protein